LLSQVQPDEIKIKPNQIPSKNGKQYEISKQYIA